MRCDFFTARTSTVRNPSGLEPPNSKRVACQKCQENCQCEGNRMGVAGYFVGCYFHRLRIAGLQPAGFNSVQSGFFSHLRRISEPDLPDIVWTGTLRDFVRQILLVMTGRRTTFRQHLLGVLQDYSAGLKGSNQPKPNSLMIARNSSLRIGISSAQ
jgi:hypothetical protein